MTNRLFCDMCKKEILSGIPAMLFYGEDGSADLCKKCEKILVSIIKKRGTK